MIEAAALAELSELAASLGAHGVVQRPAANLVVAERFPALCSGPHRCPGYGLAPSCPPHAPTVAQFRGQLGSMQHLLAFKIEALATDLAGPARLDIARRIHHIAAAVADRALKIGFTQSLGLAAGSCKELFCPEDTHCAVLHAQQPCRHPTLARVSLSAVGVDFQALAASAAWPMPAPPPPITAQTSSSPDAIMSLMAGLVLVGGFGQSVATHACPAKESSHGH